jgi:hypothetical protein
LSPHHPSLKYVKLKLTPYNAKETANRAIYFVSSIYQNLRVGRLSDGLRAGQRGFDSRCGQEILSPLPRARVYITSVHRGAESQGVKQPKNEASRPSGAELRAEPISHLSLPQFKDCTLNIYQ